ncbi:MAG: cysteine dioxygenase family protein [Xanthomonadales bacterium]|nr:cysteine dioxygenase family protein [Xanthomonadales bacterium]
MNAQAVVREFPGLEDLIEVVDQAVSHEKTAEIVTDLRRALCRLIRDPDLQLPDSVYKPNPNHYARRELYTSPKHGYSIIAMTWGPGQGTPIHDHAGMWCVEGVWAGEIEVVQYDLVDRQDDLYCFKPVGTMQAGYGSAGSLIPPHEYHTIQNITSDSVAVSVHIYSGSMTECNVFGPVGDGWYRRDQRELNLD